MKHKIITSREFEVAGDVYHIDVVEYDRELNHVTAEWWRQSDKQKGSLGYGLSDAESTIRQAEIKILNR